MIPLKSFRSLKRWDENRERLEERDEKRDTGSGEHFAPLPLLFNLVLHSIRCPHGTVLLGMVGNGSHGSWSGRRRGGWTERSEGERCWLTCSTVKWWSRTDCRHCASVTNEVAELPQTSTQEKLNILEKTLAGMGNEEPILDGRRLLERKLERHLNKLSGPKNTAKHIEAKQNWINQETRRVDAEVEKLAEMQENIKARKGTLRVAYEEIKKLRMEQESRPVLRRVWRKRETSSYRNSA